MSLPGLLIEYLITGSIALFIVVLRYDIDIDSYGATSVLIFTVLAYVVGMVVDVLAFWITRYTGMRNIARAFYHEPFNVKGLREKWQSLLDYKKEVKGVSTSERQFKLSNGNPEVKKEIEMRSSRDRVARGLMVVSFLSSLLFTKEFLWAYFLGVGVFFGLLYMNLEYLTYMYEKTAAKELLNQK